MPIHTLEPEVVAKIAAGEVVERPASVVKELVENSLDAGATQITVEIRGAGLQLIRVIDNGAGIGGGEVEKAFQRHATSKISASQDLEGISTLGFRGEALPSIAAVAQVDMLTRPRDEVAGAFVSLKEGAIAERGRRGCPLGTTVSVRHLFRSVPARLKFLKSPTTENAHISNLVTQYSLAFPEVRFTLLLEGRTAISTSGGGDLRDVLVKVYGLETAQSMLEVAASEASHLEVRGLISSPSLTRSSRSYLSFFVNRRWIQSRMLSYAVAEAYQGLLMTGRHPIAVLNILLAPQEVDVNVHPAKSEVRFRQDRAVFAAVQKAVRGTLVGQVSVPEMRARPQATTLSPSARELISPHDMGRRQPLTEPLMAPETIRKAPEATIPILRVLGQLRNTYIIAEGPDGMYLIDQHTAHERVLFERIRAERGGGKVAVQALLQPLTLELTARQAELLKERGESLSEYGFEVEPFGERTYLVRSVPALLKGEEVEEALRDILDSFDREGAPADWREGLAVSLSCHGAIKAGQTLSYEEMRELVRQLEQTELPRTCPHGRPTVIHLSSSQLEKEFGRA